MKLKMPVRSLIASTLATILIAGSTVSYGEPIKKDQLLFNEVKKYLQDNYHQEVTDEEIYDAAIRGMFRAVDGKSKYLPQNVFRSLKKDMAGEYYGIGISFYRYFDDDFGGILIEEVFPGSSADKAGVQYGDVIISIDDIAIKKGEDNTVTHPFFEENKQTPVKLTVLRNKEEKHFTVPRELILISSVIQKQIDDEIGYLHITSFTEKTYDEVTKAIATLKDKGCTKLFLDLSSAENGIPESMAKVAIFCRPEKSCKAMLSYQILRSNLFMMK